MSISLEGTEKLTKIFSVGEWEGERVNVVGDTWCVGHQLQPVDHYGAPTEFLLCDECGGIAVRPEEFEEIEDSAA